MSDTFNVSYTKMAEFRRCLQRYAWKYKDGYYPKSSIGQMRGTAGHAALAEWHQRYVARLAMDAAWEKWYSEGYGEGKDWNELQDALTRYFEWSLANDTMKLVVAEQKFEIDFDFPDGAKATLVGYIDGIVEDKGRRWLLENKFYKRVENSSLDMDMQVSTYLLASKVMEYGAQGVVYNIVRVGDTKVAASEPVIRKTIFRNPEGLDLIQDEMVNQIRMMMDWHAKGGGVYRNATKDCSWDCSFYQACLSMQDDGMVPSSILSSVSQPRRNNG